VHFNRRRLARFVPIATAIIGTVLGLGLVILSSLRRAPHGQTRDGVPGLLKNLSAAAAIVYVAFALYVLAMAWSRGYRRIPTESPRNPVSTIVAFIAVVLLISFLLPKLRRTSLGKLPGFLEPVRRSSPAMELPKTPVEQPITWGYQLGFALVFVVLIGAFILAFRARRSRLVPSNHSDRRTLVAVSLDDLLIELDHESDPRRAVLLADHGMELALAQHGLPRAVTETAQEHVQRVVAELSLSNAAAHTLTALYAQAHFSANDMTVDDRVSAISALQSVRAELRETLAVKVEHQ
jgi:hypothetical protein